MIAREKRRVQLSSSARVKREELKKIVSSVTSSYEEKMNAAMALNKKPRDESACRVKNRCRGCGRPRAVYRRFALCRICLRQAVMRGDVPGVSKASW